MGTIALSSAFSPASLSAVSSAFSATISAAFAASSNASSIYSRAIPSLRASHPLAASTGRPRGRRFTHGLVSSSQAAGDANAAPAPVSRLRILREFEPGAHPAAAGRMVISGRMVDVCAELDRLASAEAAR